MKFKRLLIIMLCFVATATSITVSAQQGSSIRGQMRNKAQQNTAIVSVTVTTPPRSKKGKKPGAVKAAAAVVEEQVLYRDIVKQNCWYVGVGDPISQDVANRLPFYYRLTMKNEKGHWQRVQAMHGNSLTTDHDKSPYIIDKRYDDSDNQEWVDKLRDVCVWYFTASLDGNDVVEERAYDKEGYVVYCYVPIKIDEHHVTGSYNDDWGYPAEMQVDSTTTYGSVVKITLDACLRDSIIDFLDGAGFRKFNINGVDQVRYTYDDRNRLLSVTSHNMVGDRTNDNWGNCGNVYTYNDAERKFTKTRIDADGKPIKMLSLRADDDEKYISCEFTLDEFGRVAEARILDSEGNPDATPDGTYRIVYTYDADGKRRIERIKRNGELNELNETAN